jgi:hypothetical protein
MNEFTRKMSYVGVRMIELICIAAFLFGLLWQGADTLKLTVPQFLMLYGGTGTVVCEAMARLLKGSAKFRGPKAR